MRNWCKLLATAGLVSLLSACASSPKKQSTSSTRGQVPQMQAGIEDDYTDETPRAEITEKESSSEVVEENAHRAYRSPLGPIAMDQNKHVDMWVRYFTGKGRKHMVRYLSRSSRYLPMMKNTLRENGLPEELVYIALIESGFSPVAHSHANAVGYWQFIRGTGKRYGLRIDGLIDERRDPVLSTKAAAEYFKTLHGMFGDWHLAMAAYNAGENRIARATRKFYTRNFWELIEKRRSLAKETKAYVPKFIAATMIASDPEKYGFTDVEYQDPLSYDTVELKNPISLSRLAQNLNVDVEEMKLLNPKFRGDYVPISRGAETVIRLPVGRANDALAAVPLSASSAPRQVASANDYFFYRIRRGDNLSSVAKKYRTSVSNLRRLNNLSNRALLRVGSRLRVPDPGGGAIYADDGAPKSAKVRRAQASVSSGTVHHVVRRGENLTTIARKYGTSVSVLLRINQLSNRSTLRVGQKIRVRSSASSQVDGQTQTPKTQKVAEVHVVKPGENLTQIATQYDVSVDSLKQWNNLKRNVIFKGQRLRLKSESRVAATTAKARHVAARSNDHKVRRGETLLGIANRYKVSVSQLARANDVSTKHQVQAGQKLVIPE